MSREEVIKKIQVLTKETKEQANKGEDQKAESVRSNAPNSLAEHIKTKEQANNFMLLLKSL